MQRVFVQCNTKLLTVPLKLKKHNVQDDSPGVLTLIIIRFINEIIHILIFEIFKCRYVIIHYIIFLPFNECPVTFQTYFSTNSNYLFLLHIVKDKNFF